MVINPDAAFSRGDIMRRLVDVERQLRELQTSRRLEAATIGEGGITLQGGRILAEDGQGERVFEVATNPASIFMRPELIQGIVEQIISSPSAKVLAAAIFAERIHVSDGWGFQAQTDEITWSDGGLGANNPTLTDIEITDAGFALVTLTGRMIIDNVHATVPGALMGAQMSMQITGATTVSPDSFGGGAFLEHRHKIAGTASGDWTSIKAGSVIVPQVLNPGVHTFAARYSSAVGDNLILVDDPSIEVIAF